MSFRSHEQSTPTEVEQKETVAGGVEKKIEELLSRQRELKTKPRFLQFRQPYMVEAIQALPSAELTALYKDTFLKIKRETDFFEEFEEAGVFDYILHDFDEGYKPFNVKVSWNEGMTHASGEFNPLPFFKEATMSAPVPSTAESLFHLAAYGDLPDSVRTLNHEATHGYQFPGVIRRIALLVDKKFSAMDIARSLHQSVELQEAHAYRYGDGSVLKSRQDVADTIEHSPLYKGKHYQTAYAVGTLEQLKALGLSSREVGELIRMHGKWDNTKQVYPNLEALVATKAREYFRYADNPQYQPKEYDYVADLENLIRVHHLEVNISHLEAQIIAQELMFEHMPANLRPPYV